MPSFLGEVIPGFPVPYVPWVLDYLRTNQVSFQCRQDRTDGTPTPHPLAALPSLTAGRRAGRNPTFAVSSYKTSRLIAGICILPRSKHNYFFRNVILASALHHLVTLPAHGSPPEQQGCCNRYDHAASRKTLGEAVSLSPGLVGNEASPYATAVPLAGDIRHCYAEGKAPPQGAKGKQLSGNHYHRWCFLTTPLA